MAKCFKFHRQVSEWLECPDCKPSVLSELLGRCMSIIRGMVDPDECLYDHHGNCQAHGWTGTDPLCPHKRAKELLAEILEIKVG